MRKWGPSQQQGNSGNEGEHGMADSAATSSSTITAPVRAASRKADAENATVEPVDLGKSMTISQIAGAVLERAGLQLLMLKLLCGICLVAVVIASFCPEPHGRRQSTFNSIWWFSEVLLAVLLSLTALVSFAAFRAAVAGLADIAKTVHNNQVELLALGAPGSEVRRMAYFGVLSLALLLRELETRFDGCFAGDQGSSAGPSVAALDMAALQGLCREGSLSETELHQMEKVDDKVSLMWIWINSCVGRMSGNADIPPLPLKAYVRLMRLSEDGLEGIRQVRSLAAGHKQTVHLQILAFMVHLNSLCCAVSLGFGMRAYASALTSATGVFGHGFAWQAWLHPSSEPNLTVLMGLTWACQAFAAAGFTTALQVILVFHRPFGANSHEAKVTCRTLMKNLENDCRQAELIPHA